MDTVNRHSMWTKLTWSMDSIWTQSMDFIWSLSPHGMGLESIWNDVGVHMEYMVIMELENGWSLSQLSFHMDSMEWLMESMESICIPYGITQGG